MGKGPLTWFILLISYIKRLFLRKKVYLIHMALFLGSLAVRYAMKSSILKCPSHPLRR